MMQEINTRIKELESKIRLLEAENEALSAKAEENLLLNKAFEEINVYDDMDSLMLNTLENISILLNIPFSGLFDWIDDQFICISSYALFSNEDTTNVRFGVSDSVVKDIASQEFLILPAEDFTFVYADTDFKAGHVVVVPLGSEIIKNRYFVFADEPGKQDLTDRIPWFQKIIRIISAKLERIYYQDELEKLNEDLEQQVASRTAELHRQNRDLLAAKEKAEESDRLKTAFLQNISHEIRTPINAIMGFSALLRDHFGNREKLEKFAGIIKQRSADLLNIINDILEISRIESGQMTLNIDVCDVSVLFSELELYYHEYQKRTVKKQSGITFRVQSPASLVIRTDEAKLKQILVNLIGNAYKFTDSGEIKAGCRVNGGKVVFYVSDTGIGISAENQTRIFDRFYQVHQENNRINEGTGLGLSIVKGLVELLGGELWLQSKPMEGSTFYFSIPYEAGDSSATAYEDTEPGENSGLPGKSVLIVEDNLFNLEYLKEILSDTGITVHSAMNGEEAIHISRTLPVDLILLDIRLPDMDGYAVMNEIRQFKPQIKFIAQTALELGCAGFITKPISREGLLKVLRGHLV
jgi:signal transduction histidine kinase/CheY-like chemotaxis protein